MSFRYFACFCVFVSLLAATTLHATARLPHSADVFAHSYCSHYNHKDSDKSITLSPAQTHSLITDWIGWLSLQISLDKSSQIADLLARELIFGALCQSIGLSTGFTFQSMTRQITFRSSNPPVHLHLSGAKNSYAQLISILEQHWEKQNFWRNTKKLDSYICTCVLLSF